MSEECVAIILAAGESVRFRSRYPKVLHPLLGKPLLRYLIETLDQLSLRQTVVVVGHGREQVTASLPADYATVHQEEQRGTGHAVTVAMEHLTEFDGKIIILCGDVPLISEATLVRLLKVHTQEGNAGTLLTVKVEDPKGLGRIVRNIEGRVRRIVEETDALPHERDIKEINTGIYVFAAKHLRQCLSQLTCDNRQGEYYLTDVIELLQQKELSVGAVRVDDPLEVMGINNREQLARAERELRRRINQEHMAAGVTFRDPDSTYVDIGVEIGRDTVLHPQVEIRGSTRIGSECEIFGPTRITDCDIGDGCRIENSVLAGARIGPATVIGPYAHLRPGTELAGGNRVGNFVETKQLKAGRDSKMSHLSYLGDAELGEKVNVGAGTITCNYDGFEKNRTTVGHRTFIGSATQLVAPVTLGDDVIVAAGSCVTEDVPPGALAISRPEQVNRENWTERYRNKKKSVSQGKGEHDDD